MFLVLFETQPITRKSQMKLSQLELNCWSEVTTSDRNCFSFLIIENQKKCFILRSKNCFNLINTEKKLVWSLWNFFKKNYLEQLIAHYIRGLFSRSSFEMVRSFKNDYFHILVEDAVEKDVAGFEEFPLCFSSLGFCFNCTFE